MLIFGLYAVVVNIVVLLVVAFYTLVERKVIASIQRRRGPNVVGIWGVLQPIADAVKRINKEVVIPTKANKMIYLMAPLLALTAALANWGIMPLNFNAVENYTNFSISALLWFCISSFGVYAIVLSGWSSNSKYAFLGSLRSSAPMISYEVFFSLVLLTIMVMAGSANLGEFVVQQSKLWFVLPCRPLARIFFIAALAETNRTPFDLPEAEAELVAGFNIEYSSMAFALFFRAESGNMFALSFITAAFFLGGWATGVPFVPNSLAIASKATLIAVLFVVVRANFPRYRYDQLMGVGWKLFLPLTFAWFLVTGALFAMYFDVIDPIAIQVGGNRT
jgi:NADH-quinone oxidoreductase subunit H